MLRSLRIRGLAVVKDVCIDFNNGFSVLTGETGAGKSILLGGLGLILGDRFSKEMLRPGEDHASVGAVFCDLEKCGDLVEYLEDSGISPDPEGQIEIVRNFGSDARSTVKVNGVTVSLSTLKEIGVRLVSISSQSDNRVLEAKSSYLELLDSYAEIYALRCEYEKEYKEYLEAQRELEELEKSLQDRAMMTDIYSYQLKEIDEVKLSDPEEEEKLEKRKTLLKDSERIIKYASVVMRALAHNDKGATASYMIERAQHAVEGLSDTLENANEISLRLEGIRYELVDIADRVNDLVGPDLEDPDSKLDVIESRLDKISKLKKKYGSSISEIIEYRNSVAEKLDDLESGDQALKNARRKVDGAYEKASSVAKKLSEQRKLNAEKMSAEITDTIKYLDIPKGVFQVRVDPKYAPNGKYSLSLHGFDDVRFLFTANQGYPLQELFKVASGGELSRTLLALKCALAEKQDVPTVVFDEIDTGVSGATSERIGLKLKELSGNVQVICVTHSPQVASQCDDHYLIRKIDSGDGAESVVQRLSTEERVMEIARIIGGVNVTSKQIQAAKEMLEKH